MAVDGETDGAETKTVRNGYAALGARCRRNLDGIPPAMVPTSCHRRSRCLSAARCGLRGSNSVGS